MPVHCVSPSALAAITRTVTVAAGRFAPGHLGELTPIMPFELVDAVLSETRTVQRRLRDLPSRVGVYFLLAMCLFPEIGYRLVWGKLTAGLAGMPIVCPSTKALRDLRRRLGSAPVRALFEVLAGRWPSRPRRGYGSARIGRCRSTAAARSRCLTASATGAGWGGARTAATPRSS
ncbi:hypothetical protein GCM10020367_63670 [Streptomyces sannanensis]|uniref:Transposase IS4 N-terminal domain-containing protein n=1 Tax=Streptomyces sannanensis TaxID=285536 RepID=A0ABP6SLM6_9ACTN